MVAPWEATHLCKRRIHHILTDWYKTSEKQNVFALSHPESTLGKWHSMIMKELEIMGTRRGVLQRAQLRWIVGNAELLAHGAYFDGHSMIYLPIKDIGILDGYVVRAVAAASEEWWGPRLTLGPGPAKPPIKGWEMGLATGGELRQKVKRDPIPEYWNWEASQLINIQILNTVAFESITGFAPPPSPISFEEYSKAELPSLSYYADIDFARAEGRTFPQIKSIGQLDSDMNIKSAVRLDKDGKLVGCVVCERNICDAM